jgi:hypothetical protein
MTCSGWPAWAIPLRRVGAQLVQNLHPHDSGPQGTHQGAIISNGSLYRPTTSRVLLETGPLACDAAPEQVAAHDARTAELVRALLVTPCALGRVHDECLGHRVAVLTEGAVDR